MTLIDIHGLIATAISLFTMGISLLALYHLLRKRPLGPDFWGAVVIGEMLIIAQAVVGGILFGAGARPYQEWQHYLYGAAALITWPAAYAFTHNLDDRRQTMWWLGISLFLFLMLTWRARITGAYPTV